jgi:menaquinone-dependent protoporphyrinogen oxidase
MKNILVVYASLEGQTEKIASRLADEMKACGASVMLANVRSPEQVSHVDLEEFDTLVFGASIHVGKIQKDMTRFISSHAAQIRGKDRSMFIVLMAAASKNPVAREKSLSEIRQHVSASLDVPFSDMEMIAGALMYSKYNGFIRLVMKRIVRKEGGDTDTARDHEYTGWEQVKTYARRLACPG